MFFGVLSTGIVGLYSQLDMITVSATLTGCTLFKSRYFVDNAVHRLQITGWRLGAAAAFTHYLLNPHVPPPLRQTAR